MTVSQSHKSSEFESPYEKGIASLADVEAIEALGLPSDLPSSTYDAIARGCALNPSAPALSFFLRAEDHLSPETWSYEKFLAHITQTANFFHSIGASKDSVIAFVLPNLPETHWTLWGAETTGIALAINPLLEGAAIADIISTAGATILVTLGPFPGVDLWSRIHKSVLQCASLKHLVLVNLADRVPGFKRFFAQILSKREEIRLHGLVGVKGAVKAIRANGTFGAGGSTGVTGSTGSTGSTGVTPSLIVHDFTRAIKTQKSDRLISKRIIAPEDYSSCFCTGGTTGQPKIAMRRHLNEVSNAWSCALMTGKGVGPGKNVFCGLPLFHCNGAMVTGLMPLSKGAHIVLGTPHGYRGEGVVKRFWEIVERHKISFFSGVPTLYASLLNIPVGNHNVSSLEHGLCGAAPMPVEVFRTFQQNTGLKILEGYGLTEGACVSSVNPPLGERRVGSIGIRIPMQQLKTAILNAEGQYERDCEVDENGALLISGPNVFAGYMLPEQNEGIFLSAGDGARWFNTGDLARQDVDGYIWLTGRKKELIIRGGHNIDPATIEEILHRHPSVQIAAAIGRPDAYAGELPVAYVQLKDSEDKNSVDKNEDTKKDGAVNNKDEAVEDKDKNKSNAMEEELLSFIKAEITERAATPKFVRVIDQMPLTAVGKIFKPTLKKMEIEDAFRAALKDAGIQVKRLAVNDDKVRGLVVSVSLPESSKLEEARRILGSYSVPFNVDVD